MPTLTEEPDGLEDYFETDPLDRYFTPDTAPAITPAAVAPSPRPIIPPPALLAEAQSRAEKQADLFTQQQEARRQGEYWEGVANRAENLTRNVVEPLTRPFSGALGRALDVPLNLIRGQPQSTPEQPGMMERTFAAPIINLPKAGQAETRAGEIAAGTYNAAAELIAGFSSPDMLALLPAGGNKAVLTSWISQIVGHTPERVIKANQLFKEGKRQEAIQEVATGIGELGMGELGRRHLVREPGAITARDVGTTEVAPQFGQDIALQLTDPRNAQRVIMPESVRELAKEPSTTGAPNALRQQEAATPNGRLSEQSVENAQLPTAEGGGEVPHGTIPPGDAGRPAPAEEAGRREVPLTEAEESPLPERFREKPVADIAESVKDVTSEEITSYQGNLTGGPTGFMWDIGARAKTPADVAALRKIAEEASAKTKELMAAGDLEGAMKVIGRQPAEAYEFATGVKLDGTPKWETMEKLAANKGKTYTPPVPDLQYLKAKGLEAGKATEPAKSEPPAPTAATPEALPADLPSLARLRITKPELRPQIDAQIAELQGAAAPAATALKQLPPVPAGHVRLFHGEGGPKGGGTGGAFYTSNITKASTFGPDVSWVDLPTAKAQEAFAKAKSGGFPGGDNFVLEPADISRSQKIGQKVEPPTHVLDEPAPKGIAASVRGPGGLKGSEAGAVSMAPLEPIAKHAIEFVKDVPRASKVVGAQLAGKSAPKTSVASEASGNALVRYASAKIAAPLVAKEMSTEVLGSHYKDAEFGKKLGAVLVEDRLRGIKDAFTKAGDTTAAAKVNTLIGQQDSPFQTEAQFLAALRDPEIKAAIRRHKQTVQPVAAAAHEEAGGTLAGPGRHTGAFVNLKAIFEGGEENLLSGGGRGNLMNPLRRPSRFAKAAAGTGEKYETDYRTISERMIEGNFEESTKRQMYDQLVKDGLAELTDPGEPAPEIGGKKAVKFVIERKGVPAGENKARTYVKNLWVREDLAGEVRQALNTDGPIQRAALVNLATWFNRIQLAGPTDAVWHTANMLGSIAGSQGGKNVLIDVARKIPGVNITDAIGRTVASSIRVLRDAPEVQKQFAELATIGAGRAEGPPSRLTPLNAMHKMITLVDRAGRLVRDDMYKNLVRRRLVEDTEANRREWVNQMGQYNPRLMGQFQRFFKDAGFSPFIVAGRNFNRMAMRRITLDPGIKAASPAAAAQMRAVEFLGTAATIFAIPALFNYLLTGSPSGRPGTKVGQIDTGKDDNGKHVVIDPAQWTGVRRGLRISGIQAIVEGVRRGETRGRISQEAIRDVMGGIIHPWAGPAVSFGSVATTGYTPTGYKESENPKNYGENIVTALEQLNPLANAYLKGKKEGTGGVKQLGLSLGGAAGLKEVKPFTSINRIGNIHQQWLSTNKDPKIRADYEREQAATFPVTKYKALDDALAKKDEAGAIQAIADLRAEGQKNKEIMARMRPFVGQGANTRVKPLFHESHKLEAAFRNSLTPEQREEYRKALDERAANWREFLKAWRKRGSTTAAPKIDFVPD